jgi:hypothetical protein
MNNIVIPFKNTDYEYYDVPDEVVKAIVIILNECANIETKIMSAESER